MWVWCDMAARGELGIGKYRGALRVLHSAAAHALPEKKRSQLFITTHCSGVQKKTDYYMMPKAREPPDLQSAVRRTHPAACMPQATRH